MNEIEKYHQDISIKISLNMFNIQQPDNIEECVFILITLYTPLNLINTKHVLFISISNQCITYIILYTGEIINRRKLFVSQFAT